MILSDSLLMNLLIQTFSLTAWAITIYSALVVNVDTVLCFLLDHEITEPLKKKQYPMTDFLSFGSLAKLLSLYPLSP